MKVPLHTKFQFHFRKSCLTMLHFPRSRFPLPSVNLRAHGCRRYSHDWWRLRVRRGGTVGDGYGSRGGIDIGYYWNRTICRWREWWILKLILLLPFFATLFAIWMIYETQMFRRNERGDASVRYGSHAVSRRERASYRTPGWFSWGFNRKSPATRSW